MRKKILKFRVSYLFVFLFLILLFSCQGEKTRNDEYRDFHWRTAEGERIEILLSQHPYAEAMIQKIPEFEALTGIAVSYHIIQEEAYFTELMDRLGSRRNQPDLFMTGAYQLWDLSDRGYVEPLDSYLASSSLTAPDYHPEDFYPSVLNSLKWDKKTFSVGKGNLLALPLGFELITLMYNKRVFDEKGLAPPRTMEDLYELSDTLAGFNGPGSFALSVRGSDSWATIHPGYMTTYSSYGAQDAELTAKGLVSLVNSPESVEMNRKWIELIRKGGPPDWQDYNWYVTGAALGDGKAAMLYDADIVGYFQNIPGSSREAGNLAWVPAPVPEARLGQPVKSNLWIWSLGMNSRSKTKTASWLFMQYFTGRDYQLWSAVYEKAVDPPRQSVFEDPSFKEILSLAEGYEQTFRKTVDSAEILFTPQHHFIETTTLWARTVRRLVLDPQLDAEEELTTLKEDMDRIFAR